MLLAPCLSSLGGIPITKILSRRVRASLTRSQLHLFAKENFFLCSRVSDQCSVAFFKWVQKECS